MSADEMLRHSHWSKGYANSKILTHVIVLI